MKKLYTFENGPVFSAHPVLCVLSRISQIVATVHLLQHVAHVGHCRQYLFSIIHCCLNNTTWMISYTVKQY